MRCETHHRVQLLGSGRSRSGPGPKPQERNQQQRQHLRGTNPTKGCSCGAHAPNPTAASTATLEPNRVELHLQRVKRMRAVAESRGHANPTRSGANGDAASSEDRGRGARVCPRLRADVSQRGGQKGDDGRGQLVKSSRTRMT